MGTNRDLRRALLDKLGVTPQALSQRAKRLKKKMPMKTEEAVYVIAHKEGIPIDKYLDAETLRRIQDIIAKLASIEEGAASYPSRQKDKGKKSQIVEIPGKIRISVPNLPEKKLKDAGEMAKVYPHLYVLELSLIHI